MSQICGFEIAWGTCENNIPCPKHEDLKCRSCGNQATRECAETFGPLVCGEALCATCQHGASGTSEHNSVMKRGMGVAVPIEQALATQIKVTENLSNEYQRMKAEVARLNGKFLEVAKALDVVVEDLEEAVYEARVLIGEALSGFTRP